MISNSQDMDRYVDKKGNVLFGSQNDNHYRENKLKNPNDFDENDSYNELNSSDEN